MSVYSAFRLGYGMTFVPHASHFKGLCLETELGLNLTPTVFAGFAYNYHQYFGLDYKRALHTLSFRLGFNLGNLQEAKTERSKATAVTTGTEKITVDARKSQFENDSENKTWKALNQLKRDGYTICSNQIVYLKQRESGSHTQYFVSGRKYIIICFSDDTNVLDIEVCMRRMNNRIDNRNAIDTDEIAMLFYKPKNTRYLKVVATNLSSLTPNSESECRIIIAYKE